MNSVCEALVATGWLQQDVLDLWRSRLFGPSPPGTAPWDPWLAAEWNKRPRLDLAAISDYYDSDAHVVFQASQSGTWEGLAGLPEILAPHVRPGTRVLEYGTGGGAVSMRCARNGAHVLAADVAPRLLEGIAALCQHHGVSIGTMQIADEIPTIPGSYDVAVCCDVMEHVEKPLEILHEIVRVLVPGGILWQEVFFGGHEMSPYHLPKHYHFGADNGAEWHAALRADGLVSIDETPEKKLWRKAA